jgi:hypothetical protein
MKAEVRGNATSSSADLGDALGVEIAQDWSANANQYRLEKRLEGAAEGRSACRHHCRFHSCAAGDNTAGLSPATASAPQIESPVKPQRSISE